MDAPTGSDAARHAVRTDPRRLLRAGLVVLAPSAAAAGIGLFGQGVVPNGTALALPGAAGVVFGMGLLAASAAQHRRRHEAFSPRALPVRILAALSLISCSAVCRLAVDVVYADQAPALSMPVAAIWFAGLAAVAFALLVGERTLAGIPERALPEATGLTRLARLMLLGLAATGVDVVGRAADAGWAGPVVAAVAAGIALAAAEAGIRSLAVLVLPAADPQKPGLLAGNGVASLLTRRPWTLPAAGRDALKSRFGIDLSRSWALDFARRSALPVAVVLGVFAWSLTSVHIVPTASRAIAERFGMPVAVLQPGMHLTLPWPLGRIRPVEFGTVHQIAIGVRVGAGAGAGAGAPDIVQPASPETENEEEPTPSEELSLRQAGNAISAAAALVPAEGDPPPEEDRLWDARHVSEATFLIASAAGGRQSFAVLQVDVSVLYRIGLDDASALRATYGVHDPVPLVRGVTGRLIERYLASVSLVDALGGNRVEIERELLAQVRLALDGLESGIDAVAVVVEALHPPPEAAIAYHRVQAAQIMAAVNVATARSRAVTTLEAARSAASTARATAAAAAADTVVAARIDALGFQADDAGWQAGPDAFTLERYLARLSKGLANARLLLVDPRVGTAAATLLDLRDAPTQSPQDAGGEMTPDAPADAPPDDDPN